MKLILPFLILFSTVSFAQDNSAAQQGIAIVEQMEKEQEAQKLPDFCRSTKKKDKVQCTEWMKANARFLEASDFAPSQEEEKDLSAAFQGIAIVKQMELDEQKEQSAKKKSKKKNCEDARLTEEEQYFCRMKQYEASSSEDRLLGCVMSMDAREITCGEKIYTLSGQVSNGSRFNQKLDLQQDSTRVQRLKSGGSSKAKKQ